MIHRHGFTSEPAVTTGDVTKIGILKTNEASLAIRVLMDTGFYSWSCSSQAGGQW